MGMKYGTLKELGVRVGDVVMIEYKDFQYKIGIDKDGYFDDDDGGRLINDRLWYLVSRADPLHGMTDDEIRALAKAANDRVAELDSVRNHVVYAHGESRKTEYKVINGKVDWASFKVLV